MLVFGPLASPPPSSASSWMRLDNLFKCLEESDVSEIKLLDSVDACDFAKTPTASSRGLPLPEVAGCRALFSVDDASATPPRVL